MSLRNLIVGSAIIYSGFEEVHMWFPGTTMVHIMDAQTGKEMDVYNWCEPPASIEEAVDKAENHVAMLEEEL